MGDNSSVPGALAAATSNIATPVAQHSIFVASLAALGCWITSSSLGETWKGILILLDLALIASIAIPSVRMAIYNPKHLTYDKDAHVQTEVAQVRSAQVFDGLEIKDEFEASQSDVTFTKLTLPTNKPA